MTPRADVRAAVLGGPSPVRGVLTRRGAVNQDEFATRIVGDVLPLYVVGKDDLRVWRDGSKLRVEALDGHPHVISNGTTIWRFGHAGDPPREAAITDLSIVGPGRELIAPQIASEWGEDGPGRDVRDVTFLERLCWEFRHSLTGNRGSATTMLVDQKTGAVLQQRTDDPTTIVEYAELTVGAIDPALFEWDGPTTTRRPMPTQSHQHPRYSSADERKEALAAELVALHLHGDLVISSTVDLSVARVISHDNDGNLEAIIGPRETTGQLTRRPHSTQIWALPSHGGSFYAWSTSAHDWALVMHSGPLDTGTLSTIQTRLHPELPVTGQPSVVISS